MDAGHVANTATAAGTPPTGAAVTATDTVDTPIAAGPAIDVDKQAGTPTGTTAGSTIAYTFVVTNTGNVTPDRRRDHRPQGGPGHLPGRRRWRRVRPTTCTATYTLTQADVDAGHVANTATVVRHAADRRAGDRARHHRHRRSPRARDHASTRQAGAPVRQHGRLDIAYTFVVTNTGNVTLHRRRRHRPKVGAVTCPVDHARAGRRRRPAPRPTR